MSIFFPKFLRSMRGVFKGCAPSVSTPGSGVDEECAVAIRCSLSLWTYFFSESQRSFPVCFYIWDKEFRNDLRSALGTYYTQIANSVTSDKSLVAKVEYAESVVSDVITITGMITKKHLKPRRDLSREFSAKVTDCSI